MSENERSTPQQMAQATSGSQQQRTGHAPKAVTVVLSGETLVLTLDTALTLPGRTPERRQSMSTGLGG